MLTRLVLPVKVIFVVDALTTSVTRTQKYVDGGAARCPKCLPLVRVETQLRVRFGVDLRQYGAFVVSVGLNVSFHEQVRENRGTNDEMALDASCVTTRSF